MALTSRLPGKKKQETLRAFACFQVSLNIWFMYIDIYKLYFWKFLQYPYQDDFLNKQQWFHNFSFKTESTSSTTMEKNYHSIVVYRRLKFNF